MTCITVHHQAVPTADGYVGVTRIASILKGAETIVTSKFCVMMTPHVARLMAEAMRDDDFGKFLKKDGDQSVGVWLDEVTWKSKDGTEVCEYINCLLEGGDGWSWEFAQALEEAADKVGGVQ